MTKNALSRRIQAAQQRLEAICRDPSTPPSTQKVVREALEELSLAVREMRASTKRPGAQNEDALLTRGQDITGRRRAEERPMEAEQQLEKQRVLTLNADRLRSLGEMAAGMAHELSQPLVGIRGIAEHVLIGLTRGWSLPHEKISEKLKLIVDQADRMEHIIQHVRIFAREAGRPEVHLVHINDVVKSSLELLEAELRGHGLEVECRLAGDVPQVMANPFSLEQVMLNLLTNARDAIEARTGKIARPRPTFECAPLP